MSLPPIPLVEWYKNHVNNLPGMPPFKSALPPKRLQFTYDMPVNQIGGRKYELLFRSTYVFKEHIIPAKDTPITPDLLLSLSEDIRRPEDMQLMGPTYFGYYWKPGDSAQYQTRVYLPRPKEVYRCACFKYVRHEHELYPDNTPMFVNCTHVFQKGESIYEIAYWLNSSTKQSVTEYWSVQCWETLKPYLSEFYQQYVRIHEYESSRDSKSKSTISTNRKKLYQDFNNAKTLYYSHAEKYSNATDDDTKAYYATLANKALKKIHDVQYQFYSATNTGAPRKVREFDEPELIVPGGVVEVPVYVKEETKVEPDKGLLRSPIIVPPDTYYTCHPYESWLDDGYEGEEVQVQVQVPTHHIMPVLEG